MSISSRFPRRLASGMLAGLALASLLTGCTGTTASDSGTSTAPTAPTSATATGDAAASPSGAGFATRPAYKNPTHVTFTIGKTVIPVTLNDSVSAKDLISRLPYTITLQRYPHDFCATMEDPLKYDPKDVHAGWMNGDVDFALTGPYFTILFENQKGSESFGRDQVNIGRIEGPLSQVADLHSDITIKIARADS